MAGDWMKIDLELPDKPEVHSIATTLNLDPDAVVGKLIRVWAWFDKHTVDGNASGVTFLLPDRISGVVGFANAMQKVGWLCEENGILTMTRFERHTSESAKQRALTAIRVANHKVKKGNDAIVSVALPREEKRRVNKAISVSADADADFSQFWNAYPRKVAKAQAWQSWKKKQPDLQSVLAAVEWQRKTEQWRDEKFIPHPATWLNQERWKDAPKNGEQFDLNQWMRDK